MLLCCQFPLFGAVIATPGPDLGRKVGGLPQAAGGWTGPAATTA